MVFNALAILQERQCAAIYDALDSGKPSVALRQADALLARQPDLHLASALRCLALTRVNRRDDANREASKLVAAKVANDNNSVLNVLCFALSALGRNQDEASVLEAASKAQPGSKDLARKACLSLVQVNEWQKLQQNALRLSKISNDQDLFFWWSMQAYSLISEDSSLQGHQLALPLAQRMSAKQLELKPLGEHSDEVAYLFASILSKQGGNSLRDALILLSQGTGKKLCERSMTLAILRNNILGQLNEWSTLYEEATAAIESGDRNWATVETAVKAAVALKTNETMSEIEEKCDQWAERHSKDRTMRLAPFYLRKEGQQTGKEKKSILELFMAYFNDFASKACTFEDLEPYLTLLSAQEAALLREQLNEAMRRPDEVFSSLDDMYRTMNAVKITRTIQPADAITDSTEMQLGCLYLQLYLSALPLGSDLPKTEMQPADDFALMSAQALVHASFLLREANEPAKWLAPLQIAFAVLQIGLQHSPKAYRLRILLIRLLFQFGAVDAARVHFDAIGVKGVQFDTLGWILSNRSSLSQIMLPPGSEEENAFAASVKRMSSVWNDGRHQVPAMVAKCFEHGTFSRIEEMVDFGKRLEYSMARHSHIVEECRLYGAGISEGTTAAYLPQERQNAVRAQSTGSTLYDQRDIRVLLNLLPENANHIDVLTSIPVASPPDTSYMSAMLDVTATAFGDEEHHTLVQDSHHLESLSGSEKILHSLARSMLNDQQAPTDVLTKHLQDLIELASYTAKNTYMPCDLLHVAAVSFEACTLLQKRLPNSQDIHHSFRQVLHHLDSNSLIYKASSLPDDWRKIMDQLASTQKQSGVRLLEEQAELLQKGTKMACEALTIRASALSRAA